MILLFWPLVLTLISSSNLQAPRKEKIIQYIKKNHKLLTLKNKMYLHFFVSFGTRTVQLKEGEAFPWSLSCKKVHLGNWHTFLIGHDSYRVCVCRAEIVQLLSLVDHLVKSSSASTLKALKQESIELET